MTKFSKAKRIARTFHKRKNKRLGVRRWCEAMREALK